MNRLPLYFAALLLAGCSQIATVKETTPRFAGVGIREPQLVTAERELGEARKRERSDPTRALGNYLAAAHQSLDRLRQSPSDKQARDLYNFAVARSLGTIEEGQLSPWDHALTIPSPDGNYALTTTRKSARPDRNPAAYKIIPADSVNIGGTYFTHRSTVTGLGAPLVAVGREESPQSHKDFGLRRMYAAVTAVIRFSDHHARIEFMEPFETNRVTLTGKSSPLAADYTAPLAIAVAELRPEKLGLIRLLRPEKYANTARLTRLQPYDPKRTPVIFVHGLQDTPASWTPMINALRDDPEIRRRYQLWVYSYPSGYPYSYSGALFRQELDAIARAYPDRKRIVLIGHSMGGMVSRLMITDAGEKIWRSYFNKPPAETNLPPGERKLLESVLIFNHRPEVKRVVFMSTPHRGSDLATNWIGRIAASLVRIPLTVASIPITVVSAAAGSDAAALQLKRIPNSIDTLSPRNHFVLEVNKLPITPGIPYHSIMGDRGRGDTPKSSDGVVAYWSSHLDGAQSELIVPSNHSSPRNPQAIAEVERILKKYQ